VTMVCPSGIYLPQKYWRKLPGHYTPRILLHPSPDARISTMKIRVFSASLDAIEEVEKIEKSDEDWRRVLGAREFEITTKRGTERPGSRTYGDVHVAGIFKCVRCGTDLFRTAAKFESGTGWPSFYEPVSELNVVSVTDTSLGMVRTEVLCARCGSHLGHVFEDGPRPTGLRYCMNGYALRFEAEKGGQGGGH
jgi:peptide-methionine (R)-S-oxide reductase